MYFSTASFPYPLKLQLYESAIYYYKSLEPLTSELESKCSRHSKEIKGSDLYFQFIISSVDLYLISKKSI